MKYFMNRVSNDDKGKFTIERKLILAAIPLIFIVIYCYITTTRYVSVDDAYIKMGIASISPQMDGVVSNVKAINTQAVKKGDVILKIDDTPFKINFELAEASLASALNQIEGYKASYRAKLEELQSAQTDLAYYQKQYDRTKELHATNYASQMVLDEAKRQLDKSSQAIASITEMIKQQATMLDGNVELESTKHALYTQAKAKLDKAKFDLDNTVLYAPFDGSVANLYVQEGSFASAGFPLFSVINNDVWIEASCKETELERIKPGQKAEITIDSFPGKKFNATVVGITRATGSEFSILPAQNSTGNWIKVTQRIVVRLEFIDKLDIPLSSGMSAIVAIDIKS